MAVVGIPTALGAATEVVPDLPRPLPCAVVVMEAATLDKDLAGGLIVVAVRTSAPEVTTPPRKRGARAAASAAQAAVPSATRGQARPHRSPTIHAARRIDEAIVLPVRATPEDDVASLVVAGGAAIRRPIRRGLATPPTEAAAAAGRSLLPVVDRAVPATPTTRVLASLGPSRVPVPGPHGALRVALAATQAAPRVPVHEEAASRVVPALVPAIGILLPTKALDGPNDAMADGVVPTGWRRAATTTNGRLGRPVAAPSASVLPAAQVARLGIRPAQAWQEARAEVLAPSGQEAVRLDARTHEAVVARAVVVELEVLPKVPRAAVLEGLREVIPRRPSATSAAIVDAEVARVRVVVTTVQHTARARLVGAQVPEGPRPIAPAVTRLQVPTGPLRAVTISLRPAPPRLEVALRATPLAGLAIAAVPARGGPVGTTGVLRAQVPTPIATTGRPTNGALLGVRAPLQPYVGVLRLATKAGQAIPVVEVARHVGPRPLGPSPAQALHVQALTAMATGVRLPYVGQTAATIGPAVRHANGAAEGRPLVVPLARAAGHGAPTEETLPEVLTTKGPRLPSTTVPFRTRRTRGVPSTLVVRTPHVPASIATALAGGTGPVALPPSEAALPPVPVPRRQGLQADATTGREVLRPSAVDVVLEAEDAAPRELAPSPLVAARMAVDFEVVPAGRAHP